MSNYNTEKLRSLIGAQGGLASPNRFMVLLPTIASMIPPTAAAREKLQPIDPADLSLICTSAQIPGKQINVMSREIGVGTKSVANGQVFAAVNLSFYLTDDYVARKYFQYWMNCVVSQDLGVPMYAGYYENYVKDVNIYQLPRGSDSISKAVYAVTLVDAFPTQMELIQLNNQAQTTAMEMTISLAYKTYKTI